MGRRPTQGLRWTPEEDAVILQFYRAYGAKGVQRRLRKHSPQPRTIPSIWHRVRRLKLSYDPTKGGKLVHLAEAHPDNIGRADTRKAKAHRHIVAAAKADGVLQREAMYPYRAMAPAAWVDEYMAKLERKFDEAEAIEAEWLTTREVGALFGISERSFSVIAAPSCHKKYSIHDHLARIPTKYLKVRTPSRVVNGKFWRAEEATREAELYRVKKARKKMRQAKR